MYTFSINDFLNKIRNRPNWVAILFWNGSIIFFFHQLIESHVMRNAGTIPFPGLRSNGKVLKLLKIYRNAANDERFSRFQDLFGVARCWTVVITDAGDFKVMQRSVQK